MTILPLNAMIAIPLAIWLVAAPPADAGAPDMTPYAAKSAEQLQALAKAGDAMAQAKLGQAYAFGIDLPVDTAKAVFWLSKSAGRGNPYGQGYLADFYVLGRGGTVNLPLAHALYGKAARQGVAEYEFDYGYDFIWGRGVDGDATAAAYWWRKAADAGYARAQSRLGWMLMNGSPAGAHQARQLFELAAAQGDDEAELGLGNIYYSGLDNVPVDYAAAFKWYSLSAAHGNTEGEHMVAALYSTGKGVDQDWDKAFFHEKSAVAMGDAESEADLAFFYKNGRGTKPDKLLAIVWGTLAAEQGDQDAADLVQSLSQDLTPDDIETITKSKALFFDTIQAFRQRCGCDG